MIEQRTTEPEMVWAGTQAEQGEPRRSSERPNRGRFGLVPKRSRKAQRWGAAQGRAGEIAGGRVGSPLCSRIARTEGVSMTKAMIFMSAPQYRQVRLLTLLDSLGRTNAHAMGIALPVDIAHLQL